MLAIEFDKLNQLEQRIHQTLTNAVKTDKVLRISEAADLCEVSPSKISKFVKKIGFANYKEYLRFISGENQQNETPAPVSNELTRISQFVTDFDEGLVDKFTELIQDYDKIIFFGYGPSLICLEYFEYKLRMVLDKNIITISDESLLNQLLEEKTIIVIFSVTGKFSNFEPVFTRAKEAHAKSLLVLEEFNQNYSLSDTDIIYLTKSYQDPNLLPYEKTRTIFFIFIEEVFRKLNNKKRTRLAALDESPSRFDSHTPGIE